MTYKNNIDAFLAQKRIAVVGVSRQTKTGDGLYDRLLDRGYEVVPVNPNMETYKDKPCYPNLQSIPDGVDAVMIATRPSITEDIVQQCVDVGIKHVWMHYNPMFGKGNTSVSEAAVKMCEDNGINVIEHGCPMMFDPTADFAHKCMHWILKVTGSMPKSA